MAFFMQAGQTYRGWARGSTIPSFCRVRKVSSGGRDFPQSAQESTTRAAQMVH